MDKNQTYEPTSSVTNLQQQQQLSTDDQQTLQCCLYQVQKLHGGSPTIARELELVLPLIMKDCVISNIEAGKNWIFKNCKRPDQCEAVLNYINALAKLSPHFRPRLHLLYLINDILHHAVARQMDWMKNAILSRLSTLLSLGYQCPTDRNLSEQQAKVIKLINIWEGKRFFDSDTIQKLRQEINDKTSTTHPSFAYGEHPPPLPPMAPSTGIAHSKNIAPSPQSTTSTTAAPVPQPIKPYYELPAGLMAVALKVDQPPYTPIDPLSVRERPSHHRKPPSKEMLNTIDTFYAGLKIEPLNPLSATVGNDATVTVGWEPGYLDKFYKNFQSTLQKRIQNDPSRQQPPSPLRTHHYREHAKQEHDHHRYRTTSSTSSRGRSPPPRRDKSPRRRESSVERRKSRYRSSRSQSRSRSRSRSPSRKSDYHRRHERRSSRRRSSSNERYSRRESNRTQPPPPRPPPSSSLSSSSSHHRHPATTTSSTVNAYQSTMAPSFISATSQGSGRMGLGHDSTPTDAFDEFRKRSSYNFTREASQRDASSGPKCYNCGKYGHFAKNCDAHLGKP